MLEWLKDLIQREQTSKKEKAVSATAFFLYIFVIGYLVKLMNEAGLAYYQTLQQPVHTPPVSSFPVVWLLIFVLLGLSGYQVWNHYENKEARRKFAALYFINGVFIYLWPYFFFTKQAMDTALFVLVALIIVIELMILTAFKASHKAAYLLIPYLLWILYATYLNINFIALNA